MIIYTIDDEPLLLETLNTAICEARPDTEIKSFLRSTPLLTELEKTAKKPDVVFLDIEMPGMGGLELARKIKTISPKSNIVFVTGFSHYAIEAYSLYPSGYVLKPVSKEKILEQLENLRHPVELKLTTPIRVQTFGNFEVYNEDEPLHFARSKSKEIFAYLIHKRGAACTTRELAAVLFEDMPYDKKQLGYMQVLIRSMVEAFRSIGEEDVIIKRYNSFAVNVAKVDCDYYRFSTLDPAALNAYTGEYMSQYGWAEFTAAYLDSKLG